MMADIQTPKSNQANEPSDFTIPQSGLIMVESRSIAKSKDIPFTQDEINVLLARLDRTCRGQYITGRDDVVIAGIVSRLHLAAERK